MNPLLFYLLFLAIVVTVSSQSSYYGNRFFGYGVYENGFRRHGGLIPYSRVGPYGGGYGRYDGLAPNVGSRPSGGGNVGFGGGLFSPAGTPLQSALRGATIGALYGLLSG
ncbi:unnamed protein product [Angiostrongylus costaricensis]|uniref:Glycine rich superfamily member n=1 Tax=Angiostrongylus costaricensis TaxID=334426 RepID=A0A0R3PCF6_ANGCS|nr:unnamed protein product [Angiostrongylus costaricensis]